MPRHDTRSEREARSVAALVPRHPGWKVQARYDTQADTWAVRVTPTGGGLRARRTRYDLLVPADGAVFALFRDGRWLGGMGNDLRCGQALPADVARTFESRVAADLARRAG